MKKIIAGIFLTIIILYSRCNTAMAEELVSPFTGKTYIHNNQIDESSVLHGIDVSKYQETINWGKVKAAGVDFALIRVGYRGYGDVGKIRIDSYFNANIKGAIDAGIDVGVYFFSQATTYEEAVEEAEYTLSKIKNYNITMPVTIDFEYAYVSRSHGGRLYNANLTKTEATNICMAFCDTVAAAGYTPMVYANMNVLNNKLNATAIDEAYDIWYASYTTQSPINYSFWQYTSSGIVDGISKRVDCNFCFKNSDDFMFDWPEEDAKDTDNADNVNNQGDHTNDMVPDNTNVVSESMSPYEIYDIPSYTYTGSEIIPALTVSKTDSNGVKQPLTLNSDYIATYSNNINAGTATVNVKGIEFGVYQETVSKDFTIEAKDISECDVSKISSYTYTGTVIEPEVTVTNGSLVLLDGRDYTMEYSDNKKIGTASVTITGKRNYTGRIETTFKIIPKKISGLKVYKKDSSSITLTWKKTANASGYTLYRADAADGSYIKVKAIRSNSTIRWTNSKLLGGKQYYYKVRAYKTVNKTNYYGANSSVLTANTKAANIKNATVKASTIMTGIVKADSLNIRNGAGIGYNLYGNLKRGASFTILKTIKDNNNMKWYKIKYVKSRKTHTGYVCSNYVTLK